MIRSRPRRRSPPAAALAALLFVLPAASAALQPGGGRPVDALALARTLVEGGEPEQALEVLEPLFRGRKTSGEAYLLRSTARFLLGAVDDGRADLEEALRRDPALRQGWLNLGALHLAEGAADRALQAFQRARDLDPDALDNGLNLGAVHLLLGDAGAARRAFAGYLECAPATAEAHLLVAKNYALAGRSSPALEHLELAIRLDERHRLAAQTDPAFVELHGDGGFQELIREFRPEFPRGHYRARQTFATPYSARSDQESLLGAVIDALRELRQPFEPRVEVMDDWAMIWGDLLVKITNDQQGRGVVMLAADPARMTEGVWRQLHPRLFREISYQLAPKIPG